MMLTKKLKFLLFTYLGPEILLPVSVVLLVPRRRGNRGGRFFPLPVAILRLFLRFLLLPKQIEGGSEGQSAELFFLSQLYE